MFAGMGEGVNKFRFSMGEGGGLDPTPPSKSVQNKVVKCSPLID